MGRLPLFLAMAAVATLLYGCAGVQSGHYIQVRRGESLASISRRFSVRPVRLQRYNPHARFRSGELVFIPLSRGLLSKNSWQDWVASRYSGQHRLLWPVPGSRHISSSFGPRWGRQHNGIDITAKEGTPIVAAAGGKVIYSGRRLRGFGNMVVVRHGGGLYTLYAHNQVNDVRVGEQVRRGQRIGRVGHTGRSTGNHLHFEIRMQDEALNPLSFYRKVGHRKYASQ